MARAFLSVTMLLPAFAGCQKEPTPESVRVELPSVVADRTPVRPVVRARRARESSTVPQGGYVVRVEPPELATPSPDGTFACSKSGDGRVVVDVQGVGARAELRCRLVERVEVSEITTLDLKKGPVTLKARAVDKAGRELSDVPLAFSSNNRDIVTVQDSVATPVAVGAATLAVRAGNAEKKVDVRVVQSIDFKAEPLRGGRRVDIELPQGNHEIEVTLKEPKELRIDWRGARQCNYRATAATHRSSCVLEEKGGAVVDNPAFVESGDTTLATDRIAVRRIP